jgi:hypothetical protein
MNYSHDAGTKFTVLRVKMCRRMIVPVELYLDSIKHSDCRHKTTCHKSSTSRDGSSKLSFTRTRNVTASRPSTIRWS